MKRINMIALAAIATATAYASWLVFAPTDADNYDYEGNRDEGVKVA